MEKEINKVLENVSVELSEYSHSLKRIEELLGKLIDEHNNLIKATANYLKEIDDLRISLRNLSDHDCKRGEDDACPFCDNF